MKQIVVLAFVSTMIACDTMPPTGGQSLVAHWGFNDSIAADNSGNGNDVAAFGATTDEDGVVGRAALLGGSDYLMGRADNYNIDDELAVSFWFKKASGLITSDFESLLWQTAAGAPGQPGITVDVRGTEPPFDVRFGVSTSSDPNAHVMVTGVVMPGRWHHVVAVVGEGALQLYVDGATASEVTLESTLSGSAEPIHFGKADASDERFFNGRLDEIRLYQRQLDPSDVARLFAEGN